MCMSVCYYFLALTILIGALIARARHGSLSLQPLLVLVSVIDGLIVWVYDVSGCVVCCVLITLLLFFVWHLKIYIRCFPVSKYSKMLLIDNVIVTKN